MLKISKIQSVEVADWDELVEKTYGRPYNFQQQDGCKPRGTHYFVVPCEEAEDFENDSILEVVNGGEIGVSFKAWLARDPKQKLKDEEDDDYSWRIPMFWERSFYPSFEVLANDLHSRGLIPAGEYQIVIDW